MRHDNLRQLLQAALELLVLVPERLEFEAVAVAHVPHVVVEVELELVPLAGKGLRRWILLHIDATLGLAQAALEAIAPLMQGVGERLHAARVLHRTVATALRDKSGAEVTWDEDVPADLADLADAARKACEADAPSMGML